MWGFRLEFGGELLGSLGSLERRFSRLGAGPEGERGVVRTKVRARGAFTKKQKGVHR